MSDAYALPEWLTDDADERAELAALGVVSDVAHAPADQVARDAQASQLLRALGRVEAEIADREAARAEEQAHIERIYRQEIERLQRRAGFIRGSVEALAFDADFGPKKKSRAVGFGTYGLRATPFGVDIVDEASALQWATANLAPAVSATISLTLSEVMQITDAGLGSIVANDRLSWKLAKTLVKAHAEATGEHDIPGVAVRLPEDKPFAKAAAPKGTT